MNKVYQVPYGTKDVLPGEMKQRRKIETAIMDVFNCWGYDEVRTPDFEYADTIGASRSDFCFFDRKNNLMALRNDMTAPIARLAATRLNNNERVKRLCYIANLYRYEEFQEGRQCEFEQAGVELLGSRSAASDAEIIQVAAEGLKAAGLKEFTISIGHVDFINGVAQEAGFDEAQTKRLKDCLRRHDAVAISELVDECPKMRKDLQELIRDLLFLQGDLKVLQKAWAVISNSKCLDALTNLGEIYALLNVYGIAAHVSFDLGLYRSFEYYTGMLFEIYLPEMGYPVAGGGRYDRMMESFGVSSPATGFALGVDRIILALERAEAIDYTRKFDCLVGWQGAKLPEAIHKAQSLRQEGKTVKLLTVDMTKAQAEEALERNNCLELVYVE